MKSSSILAFAPIALVVLACSSTVDNKNGSGGAGGSTASQGAGGNVDVGGGGGPWDPGGPVTTYHASMGPITATVEKTQCITFRMENPDPVYVRRFSTELASGSHHMILYKSTSTEESLTPTDCQGFSGLIEGDHPIFIAQQAHSTLEMPNDEDTGLPVGLLIEPNEMVRLEMHYFSTTGEAVEVSGDIQLDTIPVTVDVTPADLSFWGTDQIDIPANGEGDTGPIFQRGLAGSRTFALTTHEHHLGTEMRIWYGFGLDAADEDPVVDGLNWADPPLVFPSPSLVFSPTSDGSLSPEGLVYQCHWVNPTAVDVGFGESVNDEMCFLWQYYYPSQGFQVCIDGFCLMP